MDAPLRPPEIHVPTDGYWEKDDWHYPTPMTAFGASVYLPALEHGMATQCREFGILAEGAEQRWIGHEVYGRTVPYGGRRWPSWPWWLWAIVARLSPEIRRRAHIADEALRSGLAERCLTSWEDEGRESFGAAAAALRRRDLPALDDTALLDYLERAIELLRRGAVAHFRLNVPYALALRELYAVGRELLGWAPHEVLILLAGASSVSSAPGRVLGDLAGRIAGAPGALEVLEHGGPDVVDRLRAAAPEVGAALADYIERYGHRPTGYDPGDATLAERPELLAGLLRDRLEPSDPGEDASDRPGIGHEALERARTILAGRPAADRARFERAHAAAWRAYPVREESIFFADSLPSGVLRYTALEIGRRLVERGALERPGDAVHLTADELRAALGGGGDAIGELVARRRAERAWVIDHPGQASYGREEGTPPDLRGMPRALRYFSETWLLPVAGLAPLPTGAVGNERVLVGSPGSPGTHVGPARIVRDASEFGRLRPGDILVCPIASPAWSVLFAQAGALITDSGGASSHAGIMAREYGIPAVLGTGDATRRLSDGAIVSVDGSTGRVAIESAAPGNWFGTRIVAPLP